MTWQTIDTAPLDGTEVLGICVFKYGDDNTSVYGPWTMKFSRGHWYSSWDGARVIEYMNDFGIEYKELDFNPTHWCPIPKFSIE